MTKTCCVPGCKSNYNSTLRAGGKPVSTFMFPKDEVLRSKWVKSIRRDNWVPSKYSIVCALHFPETDIIRELTFVADDGRSDYSSKVVGLPKKRPEKRRKNNLAHNNNSNDIFEQSDLIVNFQDLILHYSSKINIPDCWNVKMGSANNKIHFYLLNLSEEIITIINQITVTEDMLVTVFLNGKKLLYNDLRWVLPSDMKVDMWSQIESLLIKCNDKYNEAKHEKTESKNKRRRRNTSIK